jgi:hypothetical protein
VNSIPRNLLADFQSQISELIHSSIPNMETENLLLFGFLTIVTLIAFFTNIFNTIFHFICDIISYFVMYYLDTDVEKCSENWRRTTRRGARVDYREAAIASWPEPHIERVENQGYDAGSWSEPDVKFGGRTAKREAGTHRLPLGLRPCVTDYTPEGNMLILSRISGPIGE